VCPPIDRNGGLTTPLGTGIQFELARQIPPLPFTCSTGAHYSAQASPDHLDPVPSGTDATWLSAKIIFLSISERPDKIERC
jgi:hypothetical protein